MRSDRPTATEWATAVPSGPPRPYPWWLQLSRSASPMMMPLRATQEAEPVTARFADEFGTVAAQAGNDVVDVVDGEHDAAYPEAWLPSARL